MVYHLSMPKRKKKEHDFSVTAFRVVQEATGQTEAEANPEEKKFDPVALGQRKLDGLLRADFRLRGLLDHQRHLRYR